MYSHAHVLNMFSVSRSSTTPFVARAISTWSCFYCITLGDINETKLLFLRFLVGVQGSSAELVPTRLQANKARLGNSHTLVVFIVWRLLVRNKFGDPAIQIELSLQKVIPVA